MPGLLGTPQATGGTCASKTFTRPDCPRRMAFASSSVCQSQEGTKSYIPTEADRSVTTVLLSGHRERSIRPHRLTAVSRSNYVNHTLPAAERAA